MTTLAELDSLAADAAAPIPSLQALLDTDDPGLHMPAIKELIGIVNDRLSQIADAVYRLKTAGEARSPIEQNPDSTVTDLEGALDVETVAINIETVVATLQMAIERLPQDGRVGDIPDVLALCRNHLSDQQQKLEEIVKGGEARS